MGRKEGRSAVHKAGLADYVTHLVKMGWSDNEIRRHLKLTDGKVLTHDQIRYFAENYAEKPDPELEKRTAAVRESRIREYDVVYERQKFARMLMVSMEIIFEREEVRGDEAWMDGKAFRRLKMLGDAYNKTLDAVKRDMFDTNRLAQATSEPAAAVNIVHLQSVRMVNALISKGLTESDAIDAIRVGTYGLERLGRELPAGLCDGELEDQGRTVLLSGPSVPGRDLPESASGGSVQKGNSGGSERTSDS